MTSRDVALLELHGLDKSFAGVRVLKSVDLSVRRGEAHALIGQNGSGKSTLIKILSGYHAPDAGRITLRGAPLPLPLRPGEAAAAGLRFLHQDIGVVRTMTVLENLRIGRFRTSSYGRLLWRSERQAATAILRQLQLDIDPDTPVRDLPGAERALIGFARASQEMDHARGDLLVLDEPTAFLPGPSVAKLFAAIREITRRGSAVIFVSHRLDEVMAIADRISILRDGALVETVMKADTDERKLVTAMLGREIGALYPTRPRASGERVLGVEGLTGRIASSVAFTVQKGEIVGRTGLLGMGHDEVPYLLFGAQPAVRGSIAIEGRALAELSPRKAFEAGMAFLPADRQRQSGVPKATVLENVSMTDGRRFVKRGRLRHDLERSAVEKVLELFDVRPRDPDRPLATLSGGNQQKALLGKWLRTKPKVILLHEPTQGVDIGSRKQVLQIIAQAAAAGAAIVVASAEYEELAHTCHRVLIFRRGRIVRELAGGDLNAARIAEQCYLS